MESEIRHAARTKSLETLIALADICMDAKTVLPADIEKLVVDVIGDYLFGDVETVDGIVSYVGFRRMKVSEIPAGTMFTEAALWRDESARIADASIAETCTY